VAEINTLAKEIDSRLFIFAPFKPMPLPKITCAHGCFYLSMINGYGLVWDCGRVFWEICRSPHSADKRPKELLDLLGLSTARYTKTTRLLWNIHAIRTDVCHAFDYSLKSDSKSHEDYLTGITNKKPANNTETDWESICVALYDQHDDAINMIQDLLSAIKSSQKSRDVIVAYLLDALCAAWQDKQDPLLEALGHLYRLSNACKTRQANLRLGWHNLSQWVGEGCRKQVANNNQPQDFDSFRLDISRKFKKLVLDKNVCPCTTDPMELFIAAIKNNYAWQDSSFRVLD
jgi:hypothetical protein